MTPSSRSSWRPGLRLAERRVREAELEEGDEERMSERRSARRACLSPVGNFPIAAEEADLNRT
eukprot:329833-Pyramimonas_sp.AAC.1